MTEHDILQRVTAQVVSLERDCRALALENARLRGVLNRIGQSPAGLAWWGTPVGEWSLVCPVCQQLIVTARDAVKGELG